MSLASLYLGVFVLTFIVVDCASIMENTNTLGEFRRQPSRIGRKLLGVAGEDYPMFPVVPSTAFKCNPNKPGYYADVEALCQVFHVCQIDGRHDSFLCPNGTLFNQNYFVCDWWYNVDCSVAPSLYIRNELLFQQHPQQPLSSRAHANSNTQLVNPDPSTENYDAPSHIILPARLPENVVASNTHQQQQTVTATAAREQQQHPTTSNAGDKKYGSKIPSVNRMGGLLGTAEIENLSDHRQMAFLAPVTESEILEEITEANPTTIQPFDEEEFTSNLKFQLNVDEQQQFAVVPVTTNAPEEFDESKITDDAKLVAPQANKDSYNNLSGEKSTESTTVTGEVDESVQNVLTANESQPLSEELTTTVQPNLASADAQTSAVVVTTLNSVSEKDLDADDYSRATTLASPTTDPAAHFLELPDVSPATEESTEQSSSSTNKASIGSSSSSDLVDDSTQSNFVTGLETLETTTFIPDISSVQSTAAAAASDNNGLQDQLTDLKATTPVPDLFSSPIVESLDFNVIATDSNSFSSGIINGNAIANIQVSSFAESSSGAPGNGSQLLTPTASDTAVTSSTTSSYTETTPSASTTTTRPTIKTSDSVISLIAYSDGKRTLYEKLKPAIVGDVRPVVPAMYGRKIHPRNGNKIPKSF